MAVVYIYHSRFSREHLHALQRDPPHNDGTPGFSEAVVAAAYRPEWYDNCSHDYENMCYTWSDWKKYGITRERLQPDSPGNIILAMNRNVFPPQQLQPWLESCAHELRWGKRNDVWQYLDEPLRLTLGDQLMSSVLNWEPEITGVIMRRIQQSRAEIEADYRPLYDLLMHESDEDNEHYVAAMLYADAPEIIDDENNNENNN
jgi:hypothetical protein